MVTTITTIPAKRLKPRTGVLFEDRRTGKITGVIVSGSSGARTRRRARAKLKSQLAAQENAERARIAKASAEAESRKAIADTRIRTEQRRQARFLATQETDKFAGPGLTTREQFKEATTQTNPVTGTLRFVASKARGKAAKIEQRTTGSARLFGGKTGKRVQTAAEIAPFFIPGVGVPLAVATGVGQFTPGGLKETKRLSKLIKEKTGVPEIVSSSAILALSAGIGIKGISTLVKRGGAGAPKTVLLGKETKVTRKGADTIVEIEGVALTKRGFFSKSGDLSVVVGKTKITPSGTEGVSAVTSFTTGATAKVRGISPRTGKTVLSKAKPFLAETVGTLTKINKKQFELIGAGRSKVKGRAEQIFLTAAKIQKGQLGTAAISKISSVKQRTFLKPKFPRSKRATGATFVAKRRGITSGTVGGTIRGTGTKVTPRVSTVTAKVTAQAIAETSIIKAVSSAVIKPIPAGRVERLTSVTARSLERPKPTTPKQKQTGLTTSKEIQRLTDLTGVTGVTRTRTRTSSGARTVQRSKAKAAERVIQREIVKQAPRQAQRVGTRLRTRLRTRQLFKSPSIKAPGAVGAFAPIPLTGFALIRSRAGPTTRKRRTRTTRRESLLLTSDFTGRVVGGTEILTVSEARKRARRGTPFGLRRRPKIVRRKKK